MKDLRNQVALVTGAASGIGKASSIEFARAGCNLVLADINEKGLEETARTIQSMGRKTITVLTDISKKEEVNNLAKRAVTEMGQVDVLYNNAGVASGGAMKDMPLADWEWQVDINFWGPIRLTHALLPHMIERRAGHIVTTASMAGIVGVAGLAAYSATKFGMVGFSEALRAEVAGYGVDVSVVCPGYVKTNIAQASRFRGEHGKEIKVVGEAGPELPSWYGYPPEKAARDIVRGVRKRKGYILIGPDARPLWEIKRLSPELYFRINRWLFGQMQRRMGLAKPSSKVA